MPEDVTAGRFGSSDRHYRNLLPFTLRKKIKLAVMSFLFMVIVMSVGTHGVLYRTVNAQIGGDGELQQNEDFGENVCAPEEQAMSVCSPEEEQLLPGEEQVCTAEEQVCIGELPAGGTGETLSESPQVQTQVTCDRTTLIGCKNWYDYPTYEKLFPAKAGKEYNPCDLEEFKQFAKVGYKMGKVGGYIFECAAEGGYGCAAALTSAATDIPTPPGLIIEGGGATLGIMVNGGMCTIHKVGKIIDKIFDPPTETVVLKNLVTLENAVKKWCRQYDNQQGQACNKLMQAYDKCLALHSNTPKPYLYMYFVPGAIANGQDPCFWKR